MNKKRLIGFALAGNFPVIAMAGGNQGGHDVKGHEMAPERHSELIGKPGNPTKVDRTIDVIMHDDMRVSPSKIEVKAGETLRFFVRNAGKVPHEMVLGTLQDLVEHAAMMRKMPEMEHVEPNMVKLNSGQRGGFVWQFTQGGTVDFACTLPGHREAGMVGKVLVSG